MPPQTLKRQAEDMSCTDDDIDDNEWGGTKRSRYPYSYTLKSPDLFPNINDPNQTEIEVVKEPAFSTESNCDSGCTCCTCCVYQFCSSLNLSEFKVTNGDPILDFENGYAPDDRLEDDTLSSSDKNDLAHFKNCLICKQKNTSPNFQYCGKCFINRMKLSDIKPNLQPKSIKQLNKMINHLEELRSYKNSQESLTSQESSSSLGLSGLNLSDKSVTNEPENICHVCFIRPKNGIFNHGQTGHNYSCYRCSKKIWARSGRCPICNLKIRYVTKAIYI